MKILIALILWNVVAFINGINSFLSIREFLTVSGIAVIIILLGYDSSKNK